MYIGLSSVEGEVEAKLVPYWPCWGLQSSIGREGLKEVLFKSLVDLCLLEESRFGVRRPMEFIRLLIFIRGTLWFLE